MWTVEALQHTWMSLDLGPCVFKHCTGERHCSWVMPLPQTLRCSLSVVFYSQLKNKLSLQSENTDLPAGTKRACLKDRMMSTGKENEGTQGGLLQVRKKTDCTAQLLVTRHFTGTHSSCSDGRLQLTNNMMTLVLSIQDWLGEINIYT